MKTTKLTLCAAFVSLFILLMACQRNASGELMPPPVAVETTALVAESQLIPSAGTASLNTESCNPNAYIIILESRTLVNGNWEWVWSVQNSNPGNGNGGTVQDLSNWGMQFGSCFVWSAVVGAAYSNNNIDWTGFTPSYSSDPSQSCLTTPVLKFDYGTTGSAKTYYRLILNQEYPVGDSFGYYKSGNRTGCCTFSFSGVGCEGDGGPR